MRTVKSLDSEDSDVAAQMLRVNIRRSRIVVTCHFDHCGNELMSFIPAVHEGLDGVY